MVSKRIPVREKTVDVTGRRRRLANRSSSSTLSLARDRVTLFPRARVPVHIRLQRWCLLDGAARAGTAVPSDHQGLCRWPHRLPQDSRPHLWEPQAHSAQTAPSISVSSVLAPEHLPLPPPVRLPPQRACAQAESQPTQKYKQIQRSMAISKRP